MELNAETELTVEIATGPILSRPDDRPTQRPILGCHIAGGAKATLRVFYGCRGCLGGWGARVLPDPRIQIGPVGPDQPASSASTMFHSTRNAGGSSGPMSPATCMATCYHT